MFSTAVGMLNLQLLITFLGHSGAAETGCEHNTDTYQPFKLIC